MKHHEEGQQNVKDLVAWTESVPIHLKSSILTLLHSEWPKLHRVLAILSAVGKTSVILGQYCSHNRAHACGNPKLLF